MAVQLIEVDNPSSYAINVTDLDGATHSLLVTAGVALCTYQGTGSEFIRDTLTIPTGLNGSGELVYQSAVAIAWPTSMCDNGGGNPGWAVDRVDVTEGGTKLVCHLAVRDPGGFLLRVGFRIDALFGSGGDPGGEGFDS
jgi:hypothetical protein